MLAALLAVAIVPDPAAIEVAEKLATALEGLETVSFTYRRDLRYKSEGYQNTLVASMYVAFDSKALPTRAKFRAVMPDGTCAFDGVRYWFRKRDGSVYEENPPKSFPTHFLLKNSVFNLAPFLRQTVKNHPETLKLDGEALVVALPGTELSGATVVEKVGYDPSYTIKIDPKLGLPTQILQQLKLATDTITTTFSNWNLKQADLKESDWNPG